MWRTPKLLDRHNCGSKDKITEEEKVGVRSLIRSTSRLAGHVRTSKWGLGRVASGSIIHTDVHKPTTSWLVCSWSTFGARTNQRHTQIHKTHHGPNLGGVTTFPLIVFSVISHGGYIQMSFFPETPKLGIPKFSKLGLMALWKAITCVDL
jgi:hypothetical protein